MRASRRRFAPLELRDPGREPTAQHEAFVLERAEREVHVADRDSSERATSVAVVGPTASSRPRTSSRSASSRVHTLARSRSGTLNAGSQVVSGERRLQHRQPLGGHT